MLMWFSLDLDQAIQPAPDENSPMESVAGNVAFGREIQIIFARGKK
jgi:hypothetical protein